MSNTKEELKLSIIDALDISMRGAYHIAMNKIIDEGYNPRQVLSSDFTKPEIYK